VRTPEDAFPTGCVACHVKENRISTLLAQWNGKVNANVTSMQAFVPKAPLSSGPEK